MTSVYNHSTGYADIGSSIVILIVQLFVLICLIRLLYVKSTDVLDSVRARGKIGNLY